MRCPPYSRGLAYGLAFALTVLLAGCTEDTPFTRVPVAGVLGQDQRPNDTTVFVTVPVDLAGVLSVVDAALPEQLARTRDFVDDIACDRRKSNYLECMGATVTSALTRQGPLEISTAAGRLMVTVPLRYEISAKGQGWAAYLTDRKAGAVAATIPLTLTLGAGYRLDIAANDAIVWSEKSAAVLKGKIAFSGLADAKLKSQIRTASGALRDAITTQPVRDTVEKAWLVLHQPLELASTPSLWLRGLPERVTGLGLAPGEMGFVYKLAIDARVGIHQGAKPAVLFAKPLPEPARLTTAARVADPKTTLRLPVEIGTASLAAAIIAAFPKTELIETRADAKATILKVRPSAPTLFAARDRLALELQIDVVEPRRLLGLTGKAYLLGRPVYDPATGILGLDDVAFPAAPARDAKTNERTFRIGLEPFASRFAAVVQLDVGPTVKDLLPRINRSLERRVDETLALRGQFDQLTVQSVDPAKDGFRLNLELSGALTLTYAPLTNTTGSLTPTAATR